MNRLYTEAGEARRQKESHPYLAGMTLIFLGYQGESFIV
jgi:hypothetical protein